MSALDSAGLADLERVVFESFSQFVLDLLAAVGQPEATIARLREYAASHPSEPIALHKRAVFVEVPEDSHPECLDKAIRELKSETLILFCVSHNRISAQNLTNRTRIEFAPKEISKHYSFLLPLVYGKRADFPQIENQKLGELIAVLNNKLIAGLKSEDSRQRVPNFALDVVKLGIHRCFANDAELDTRIRVAALERGDSQRSKYRKLLSDSEYSKSLVGLSDEQANEMFDVSVLEQIGKLLSFDYRVLGSEVIGSLIYRIVDASCERQSHTVSESNSARILTPTLFEPYLRDVKDSNVLRVSEEKKVATLQGLRILDPTNGTGTILATAISSIASFIKATSRNELSLDSLRIENFAAITNSALGAEITRMTLWLTFLKSVSSSNALAVSDVIDLFRRVAVYETDSLSADWSTVFGGYGPDIVVGAPTFKGWIKMSDHEKAQLKGLYGNQDAGGLDYSAAWLLKAAQVIRNTKAQACFALTNSLVQGAQVGKLWPAVFSGGIEIGSAFPSEKWTNDTYQDTGVSVVVIAIRAKSSTWTAPTLRYRDHVRRVDVIGPYLIGDVSTIVTSRSRQFRSSDLPSMIKGNMPYDGGSLLLSAVDRKNLVAASPGAEKFIRAFVGAAEFIHGHERYCLWIPSEDIDEAKSIPEIARRIIQVEHYRSGKSDSGAQLLAKKPHQFREFRSTTRQSLVVPSVSSELRKYVPIGFVGKETIVSNLCFVIYESENWLLALLSSRLHMNWVRTTCGYLETRLRYSNRLGYNTFPLPRLVESDKQQLSKLAYELVSCREKYLDRSLGEIYSDMPLELEVCHSEIDKSVENIYGVPADDDDEQLRVLLKMYTKLVSDDKE